MVIGALAAICTTSAFIPQILKIRRQGGDDLSYSMLSFYLTGTVLWLAYGLILHAAAVIWANAVTAVLVFAAIVMKAMWAKDHVAGNPHAAAWKKAQSSAPLE